MVIPLFDRPFLFMRHGETADNAANRIGGTTDSPLTARGLAQAEAAALVLRDHPVAAIWHSPLRRAAQTAAAVARVIGAPLVPLAGLAERNWGAWEGRDRSILVRSATPPGGEAPEAFRDRIRAALAAIAPPFPVLIVAHSGTGREIHAALTAEPLERLENAVPVIWRREEDGHWTCTKLSPLCQTQPLGRSHSQG